MKKTLLLSLLIASLSMVAQAAPCVSGGTLASYIGLGAGGCTFDSLLFNNFTYENSSSGGGVAPDAAGVKVDTVVQGPEAGLEFVASWLSGSGQTSDGNIGFTVTCQDCKIDDLKLIMDGIGLGTGLASVAEISSSPSIGLGTTSSVGFNQFSDSKDIAPIDSLNLLKDIGTSGGTAGSGHVSAVFNLFSTTQTTMTPEPSLMLLCMGALCLVPVVQKIRRA
ncbi:MAG TPA: hypothetical protein VKT81_09695 [Bryobacteraceae bacterium]|nr:hypothetical protein [Bryobacteraceae bacterium]